ncbi:MAG: toll/interleukin-1 receptor domain-containing protein [Planctomycetaceae bacterium]
MDRIIAVLTRVGLDWVCKPSPEREEGGLEIIFNFSGQREERQAIIGALECLEKDKEADWLYQRGSRWVFDTPKLKRWLAAGEAASFLPNIEWITGPVVLDPKLEYDFDKHSGKPKTRLLFCIYKNDYAMQQQKRIFLSHKGADKPKVQQFHDTLELLGFDPWLDVVDMPAGSELHRSIRDGFKDSCAAVFFITPNFVDASHLRNEVNYAVEEKTAKADRFSIISLVFNDADGKPGIVPDLLKSYIYIHPKDELEALREIIRAMPIQVGPVHWRPGV